MYTPVQLFSKYCITNNILEQIRCVSQLFFPQFSSDKYKVKRHDFSTVRTTDIDYFKSILGKDRILTDDQDVAPYNIDWIKNCRGNSQLVLKPSCTEEVSKILSYCNEKRLAVCPQGGNTGVVGGSVPVFDEIILNLSLMDKITSFDDLSGALVCEAGCILENLDKFAREHNMIMPLDLGAKGTCHIGGNVSTNAGGLRLLRYGNLHGSVLGIEAVKADGSVINCLKSLRKDNTGYHLKHLFIGSEGTLGVVTKVAIHCPVMPKAVTLGYFGVENFENILYLYSNAKSSLGEILSAFEMADCNSISHTVNNLKLQNPLAEYPFYVILETHGSDEIHDQEKLTRYLSTQMKNGLIVDGIVTAEPSKMQSIWTIRENIAAAGLVGTYLYAYDVSLPQKHYYEIIPKLRERLNSKVKMVCGFGHIGDGNIHINIIVPEFSEEVYSLIEPFIFEEVSKLNGSISAEHGVGFRKPQYLHYSKDPSALQLMRDIKQLMDPNGILNPYKVLP
ncbi:hypothetical protein ACJJTC_019656 [Scirpophaga incertulas]